jgi:DnaJ family protein C protein 17
MKKIRTLYTWLDIPEDASKDQIKKAYRAKAMDCHPDRGGDPEVFAKISEAHTVLMDDDRRAKYDKKVRETRLKLRIEGIKDSAFSKLKEMWEYEDQVDRNRRESPQSDYFAEQDRLERDWQEQFARMMKDYQEQETLNSQNLESILRSTDDLLTSFANSGKIRFKGRSIQQDPLELHIDPEIKIPKQAREVLFDLRDTISKAERLVRMFNKLTGDE